MSEQDSWEIDPLEKDWMLASAQADLQVCTVVCGDANSTLYHSPQVHNIECNINHAFCQLYPPIMLEIGA